MADHHEAAGRLFQAGSRANSPEMVELRGLSPRRLILWGNGSDVDEPGTPAERGGRA